MSTRRKTAKLASDSKAAKQNLQYGKKLLYVGLLGARFRCFYCGAYKKKAMVVEYDSHLFCSHDCTKWWVKDQEAKSEKEKG